MRGGAFPKFVTARARCRAGLPHNLHASRVEKNALHATCASARVIIGAGASTACGLHVWYAHARAVHGYVSMFMQLPLGSKAMNLKVVTGWPVHRLTCTRGCRVGVITGGGDNCFR